MERNQLYFEQLKKKRTNELEIYMIIEGWNTNIKRDVHIKHYIQ